MPLRTTFVLCSCLVVALLLIAWWAPWLIAFIPVIIVVSMILNHLESRRLRRLALAREGHSICTFARSFDYRAIDTWIIRAVYEELQSFHSSLYQNFPILSTDRLNEDIRINPDELDDLVVDMARRARRALRENERNPMYDKVYTVGDLVTFLAHQPLAEGV